MNILCSSLTKVTQSNLLGYASYGLKVFEIGLWFAMGC